MNGAYQTSMNKAFSKIGILSSFLKKPEKSAQVNLYQEKTMMQRKYGIYLR